MESWLEVDVFVVDGSGMSQLQLIQRLHCNIMWRTFPIVTAYSNSHHPAFLHIQYCKIKLFVQLDRLYAG
jgi:hypothetical protein